MLPLQCERLLLLSDRHVIDQRVLLIIGNADLRANVDHKLADRLAVIDQQGPRLAVQETQLQLATFIAVVDLVA